MSQITCFLNMKYSLFYNVKKVHVHMAVSVCKNVPTTYVDICA